MASSFANLLQQKKTFDKIPDPPFRACLHGGGGPQVGEVTRLGEVTHLSI